MKNLAKSLFIVTLILLFVSSSFYMADTTFAVGSPSCAPPPSGIAMWLRGEDNALDTFSLNDGTLVNGTTFTAGKVGRSFDLDGIDDYLTVPSSPDLDVGTGSGFSLEAWVNPISASSQQPLFEFNSGPPSNNLGAHFWMSVTSQGGVTGNLYANIVDTGGSFHIIQTPAIMTANEFQHVVLTYDKTSGIANIYRNGVFQQSQNLGTFTPKTNFDLYLGARPGFGVFGGKIDEPTIYSRALTLSEIQSTFNAQSSGKCLTCISAPTGLVSLYSADGNTLDARSRNNGTLVNGAAYASGKIGQAFSFDGIDDNVDLGNWFTYTDFTISMWVKPGATQIQYADIIDNNHTGGQNWVLQQNDNNTNVYRFSGTPDFSLTPNVWQHLILTHDNANMSRVYVNGVLTVSGLFAINYNGTQFLRLGRWGNSLGLPSNRHWNGQLDELAIFDRALTPLEVRSISEAGVLGMCKPTATVVPPGLAGWWTGNGDATDISGNGNNGTLQNGASFAVNKVGQGFYFDGTDDYVSTSLDVQPTAMSSVTFEAWVYPTRPNSPFDQAIFSGDDGGWDRQLGIAPNGLTFRVQTGAPATFDAATVDFNQWQHVAVVYTPTEIKLYKNGVEFNSGIVPVGQASSNKLVLGSNRCPPCVTGGATQQYQGNIDEPSVYNRALSAAELTSIYNAGLAGKLISVPTNAGLPPIAAKSATRSFSSPMSTTSVAGDVTVTFQNVTVSGMTQEIPLDLSQLPPLPMGTMTTGLTYDVNTSALFTGNIDLCFNVPALTAINPTNLRVYHLESGGWIDRTASGATHSALCTTGVTSLSPFAIVNALAPTAANVSVSGRVTSPTGRGISRTFVAVSDQNGVLISIQTNSFGYYRFSELAAGQTYIFTVSSKQYEFAPQVVYIAEDLTGLDFNAISGK